MLAAAGRAGQGRIQVTAAATLAEARACLAQAGPQVLLTDLQLPDGHGIELIRETRQRFPDLATIIPRTSKRAFALRALASLSPALIAAHAFHRHAGSAIFSHVAVRVGPDYGVDHI
jgi:DNA-binding NarL/FixJ family response regulator